MEHDLLQRAFLVGGAAAGLAVLVAAVMLVWWLNGRRRGQPAVRSRSKKQRKS
jgi:nitrate reductase gamma subunit